MTASRKPIRAAPPSNWANPDGRTRASGLSPHALFPLGEDRTTYRKLDCDGVRIERALGREIVVVAADALRQLAEAAFVDINHRLRPSHFRQLRGILEDPEASQNDRFVAYDLIKNANIAAGGVLPMCQDSGTAIIFGKKGRAMFAEGDDEAALAAGARDAYLPAVREACKKHGGFYLGSIGGSAANLAENCVRRARHGGDLADRGREFFRLHRHRRQEQ